ncbi:uncharacterized protein L199_004776 [Kwoniella botswanensis]|uniref:uncharacterized protein n=1 Tax=Kwoniella botswanensis TaxID=1268659 RepID=UPI00315D8815
MSSPIEPQNINAPTSSNQGISEIATPTSMSGTDNNVNYRHLMHEALYGCYRPSQREATAMMDELVGTSSPEVNDGLEDIRKEWREISHNSQDAPNESIKLDARRRKWMEIYERTHDLTDDEKTLLRAIHECSKPDRLSYKSRFMEGMKLNPTTEKTDERTKAVRSAFITIQEDVGGAKVKNRERRKRWWDVVGSKDERRTDHGHQLERLHSQNTSHIEKRANDSSKSILAENIKRYKSGLCVLTRTKSGPDEDDSIYSETMILPGQSEDESDKSEYRKSIEERIQNAIYINTRPDGEKAVQEVDEILSNGQNESSENIDDLRTLWGKVSGYGTEKRYDARERQNRWQEYMREVDSALTSEAEQHTSTIAEGTNSSASEAEVTNSTDEEDTKATKVIAARV